MNDHADDNELFKKLIQKPRIAWPTVMLLIAAFTIFGVWEHYHWDGPC